MSASEDRCEHGMDIGAYVLGALDEYEVEPFREHLAVCPECREELAQLQGVADSLASAVPRARAPEEVRARLMAGVRSEAELLRAASGHDADRPARARPDWRWRVLPALVAAGALAAGVLSGGLSLNTQSSQPTRVIKARVLPPAGHGATAEIRKVGSRVELVVTGMPAPALGSIYEVWLKDGHRPPKPTDALFSVTGAGDGTVAVPGNLKSVTQMMVTEEPAGGSLKPTHPPVILASV